MPTERDTGRTNRKILDNLRRLLAEKVAAVYPRVPLVPGITATRENLSARGSPSWPAADNVSLAYNPLGADGAVSLEESRLPVGDMPPDEEEEVCSMFQAIIEERGAQHESGSGCH